MRVLMFPGLGLEIPMERIAFRVPGLGNPVYWYGIIIVSGLMLAVWFCSKQAPKFGLTGENVTDMMLYAVPACLIGARLYYVIFYLDLYRRTDGSLDFGAMVRIWDGGIAIYGAVLAAIVVVFLFCKAKKLSFLAFADLGIMGLFIGQSIGRWGNFINMEAYGGITDVAWRMSSVEIAEELLRKGQADTATYEAVLEGTLGVHPTFFYESLWNLIGLLLVLYIVKKGRRFDGQSFFTYLAWYGLGRFWIEGLRTDSLYLFGTGLRVSQVVALVSVVIGGTLLVWYGRKKAGQPLYVEMISKKEETSDGEGT